MRLFLFLLLLGGALTNIAQTKVFPGASEVSPSRSQYSSWINHTNEGPTEEQTLINLSFFQWLHDEYGMLLDIYAMDAGVIDGKSFYGNTQSKRFKEKFQHNFDSIYQAAKQMNTRLGIWGGPDGFGNTSKEMAHRKKEMIDLCEKYDWALFKFDAVCGPLRSEKEDDFIDMMRKCREFSPDLILLNHRLGLDKAKAYATTFLWEGQETYIDVHTVNSTTAPHNRAGALGRGLVPNLQRLTEDCGVCISSCLNYWEDDLILQAFNRSLILSPEIYGNPWLLNDDEFARLARIYNLHRKYASILVNGMILPASYGPYAVARGDGRTRLLTLRNLSWQTTTYSITLNEEIGLTKGALVKVKLYHPTEKIIGSFHYGDKVEIAVPSYRACLLMATTARTRETEIIGTDYYVIKDIPNNRKEIQLLGMPGTTATIKLPKGNIYKKAFIDGKEMPSLVEGASAALSFAGISLQLPYHRKLTALKAISIPVDAETLYESTVFAADNNALEVRSLQRSGETKIEAVKQARNAFFTQKAFVTRGIWDKYLFDGDMKTGFWPTNRYNANQKVLGGCFRLDIGEVKYIDKLVIRIANERDLEPLLIEEGSYAEFSTDLITWKTAPFLTGLEMEIEINEPARYFRLSEYPHAIAEIEAYAKGQEIDSSLFRASNLFASNKVMLCKGAWQGIFQLSELAANSYLCVAINGNHGVEGAYAALKINGEYVGAPTRALSYPSNTWEYLNRKSSSNYTYYFPLDDTVIGKKIEVFVLGYQSENLQLSPEVWITAYPLPFVSKKLVLI